MALNEKGYYLPNYWSHAVTTSIF